jgi:hypothetical protein
MTAEDLCRKFGTMPNYGLLFGQKTIRKSPNLKKEVRHALEYRDALQDAA